MIVDDILIACDKIKALTLMFSEERDVYYYLARTKLDELVKLMSSSKNDVDYELVLANLEEIKRIINFEEEEDVQASV